MSKKCGGFCGSFCGFRDTACRYVKVNLKNMKQMYRYRTIEKRDKNYANRQKK